MSQENFEMLLMRNAHTPYKLDDKKAGSELGPISQEGIQEATQSAAYLTNLIAGRSLKFYASPFTRRARDTALYTAAYIQQNGAPMPIVNELFKVPDDMQPIGYTPPDKVALREYEATLTLEDHLRSVEEILDNKVVPVVVMSGRAIWLSFGLKLNDWPAFGEATIPTAGVFHMTKDHFKGYMPHGHKAEALARHLEEQRKR